MRRLVAPLAVVLAFAFAVWVFFAPHLTVRSMRLAAESGDAQALSKHVDFPALRQSVKEQLAKELGERVSSIAGDSQLGRFGAQIAGALGNSALNPAVEAMVRPETLSMMLAGRDLANEYSLLPSGESEPTEGADAPDLSSDQSPTQPPAQSPAQTPRFNTADIRATMGYESLGRFAINVQEPRSGRHVKLILTRDKLFWWKLSAVELDAKNPG